MANFWDDDEVIDFAGGNPIGQKQAGHVGAAASFFVPAWAKVRVGSTAGKRKSTSPSTVPVSAKAKAAPIPPASGIGYVPATMVPMEVMSDLPFQDQVTRVSKKYNMAEDDLYRVMAFETGNSFSTGERNNGGGSATGLIQFLTRPGSWAQSKHGLTREKLSKMSRAEQMGWVDRFLSDHGLGKVAKPNVEDIYLTVLNPGFRGTARDFVHFREGTDNYIENQGFDREGPGHGEITIEDIVSKVFDHDVTGLGKYRPPKPAPIRGDDSNLDALSRIGRSILQPGRDWWPPVSLIPGESLFSRRLRQWPSGSLRSSGPKPAPRAEKSPRPKPRSFFLDKYSDWQN